MNGVSASQIPPRSPTPTDGSSRLIPLGGATPIRLRTDRQGIPTLLRIRSRSLRVEAVRESWRIDDEWWRRPISRWYLSLVLENGRLVTVYRDLVEDEWFLQ